MPSLNYIQLCDCTVSKEEKNKKKEATRDETTAMAAAASCCGARQTVYTHTCIRGNNRFRESTR